MRSLILAGAAALALGAVPAFADDGSFFPDETPCTGGLTSTETQCAANVALWAYGRHADQTIKQRQSIDLYTHDGETKGNVQWQTGLNVSVGTYNNDQSITQHQSLKTNDPVYGEQPNKRHDDTTQVQVGVNLALGGSNSDQSIHQGQSLENWSNDPVGGSEQAQGAVNVSVGSNTDQSISQHQSIEIH